MTTRALRRSVWSCLLALNSACAEQPFTGEWQIDLRTSVEQSAGAECGIAKFRLVQVGEKVSGEHSMAPAGCGRLNEGGERTVEGTATGNTAILLVTSDRNGEIVRGRAIREGANLRWTILERVKLGEPPGDSGLILDRGLLRKVSP